MIWNQFLNANQLECNENLQVGNLDSAIQILCPLPAFPEIPRDTLIVARAHELCFHTHWVTVLWVKSQH